MREKVPDIFLQYLDIFDLYIVNASFWLPFLFIVVPKVVYYEDTEDSNTNTHLTSKWNLYIWN